MELTFWNIARVNVLGAFTEYFCFLILFQTLLNRKINKKKAVLFAAAYVFYICIIGSAMFYKGLFRMKAAHILFCYMTICFWMVWVHWVCRETWKNAAVISGLAEFFYLCALDMTGFAAGENYDLSVFWDLIHYIIVDWFGSVIVVLVIAFLLRRARLGEVFRYFIYEDEEKREWRGLLLLLPVLQYGAICLVNEKRLLNNSNPMVSLLGLLLVYSFFNYAMRCEMQRKQMVQQELSLRQQELYIQNLEKVYQDVRMFRHDYKNMMSGIYVQAEEGDLKAVQEFVSGMMDDFEMQVGVQIHQSAQLENIKIPEIKGLFLAKYMQAQSKNIQCRLEVMEPIERIGMPLRSFCRVAGILLDNALEAVEEGIYPQFTVMFSQNEVCTTLRIKNPAPEEVPVAEIWREGYSTKGEGRGLGLAGLRRILDSYENVYSFSHWEKGEFVQEIKIREAESK